MRVVTFHKGMFVRQVIRWMVLEDNLYNKVAIPSGSMRRLPMDMTYPMDDFDFITAAHDLAHAHGLVLYQDHLKYWRVRSFVWKRDKELWRQWQTQRP